MSNSNNNSSNGTRTQRNDSITHSGMGTGNAAKRNYSSSDASSHQRTTSSTPSKPATK